MPIKPDHICKFAGCCLRAKWHAELVLLGTPLKGATTIRVCSHHRKEAEAFILNDENRTRLCNRLVLEGLADPFIAYGTVKHNAAVRFDRIPTTDL